MADTTKRRQPGPVPLPESHSLCVWAAEEDSKLSEYQKRVLRDQRVTRMLKEMRAAKQDHTLDTTPSPASSHTSGYSSGSGLGDGIVSTYTHPFNSPWSNNVTGISTNTDQSKHGPIYPPQRDDFSTDTENSGDSNLSSSGNESGPSTLSHFAETDTCYSDCSSIASEPTGRTRVAAGVDKDSGKELAATEGLQQIGSDFSTNSKSHRKDQSHTCSECLQEQNPAKPSEVIHTLKRRSDAWNGPAVRRSESVTARLREGRETARRRQENIEELLGEATSQLQIQRQAHAALQLCEGKGSVEEIEAERLILLAGERYKAFQNEAEKQVLKLSIDDTESTQQQLQPCTATLFLSDISITLSEMSCKGGKPADHHFLCLVRELKTQGITATQSTSLAEATFPRVDFSNRFTLPDIPNDFELVLEIYYLLAKSSAKGKHTKRNEGKKKSTYRKLNCGLCTSSMSLPEELLLSTSGRDKLLQSRFTLIGKTTINKHTLGQDKFQIKSGSRVQSVVASGLMASVFADPDNPPTSQTPQGYLSVYDSCWHRRWFALAGCTLSSWVYPDQPENHEKPLADWDLSQCAELAYPASPTVCAWPHSFVIPLRTRNTDGLLLSADSEEEKMQWIQIINDVVFNIVSWEN